MNRIVQKFGGTSVGSAESIKNVAIKVKAELDEGNQVAVVLSAMAGETDRLIKLLNDIAPITDFQEFDSILASGEQVSSGLLAMGLKR